GAGRYWSLPPVPARSAARVASSPLPCSAFQFDGTHHEHPAGHASLTVRPRRTHTLDELDRRGARFTERPASAHRTPSLPARTGRIELVRSVASRVRPR